MICVNAKHLQFPRQSRPETRRCCLKLSESQEKLVFIIRDESEKRGARAGRKTCKMAEGKAE